MKKEELGMKKENMNPVAMIRRGPRHHPGELVMVEILIRAYEPQFLIVWDGKQILKIHEAQIEELAPGSRAVENQ
jgi:hypothetical protein